MSIITTPWERNFEPLKMIGNLYFVGTEPASVHIIDTGEGLIMLDSGYQQSLFLVIDNMYKVGQSPHDIKYIMLTHGHIDHFGGARALKELTGAKIVLGRADEDYATGKRDLSYAKELGMNFYETFRPDILIDDGDEITLGNTTVRAVATPGHTEGAMSYFFDVEEDGKTYRAGLHGGMGINTLSLEFLDKYGLPHSLREDFVKAMLRLNEEKVDIFLGNHMQHNDTTGKAARVRAGDKLAFVNPDEWEKANLAYIENFRDNLEKAGK